MSDEKWGVEQCKEKHWNGVKRIWENRINTSKEHVIVWLRKAVQDDNQVNAGVVTNENDNVVGFGFYAVGNDEWMEPYLQNAELYNAIKHGYGMIETVAVKEEVENNGIASEILAYELEMLREQSVEYAYSVSWNREHTVDSRVLFDKFEFSAVSTVEDYYQKLPDTVTCIDCTGKCTCEATIYKKKLGTEE
jgi:ribosomal protein S18 acetylase RimI-like enzyme